MPQALKIQIVKQS